MDIMKLMKLLTLLLLSGTGAVAALNQTGTPVPGLEWLRADTALQAAREKIGLSSEPAATPDKTADAADGKGGKGKRNGTGGGGGGGGGGHGGGGGGNRPPIVSASSNSIVANKPFCAKILRDPQYYGEQFAKLCRSATSWTD